MTFFELFRQIHPYIFFLYVTIEILYLNKARQNTKILA